ncbi:MAG: AAA family ATPase [Dehalococcoidia bacterium]|jgi:AAA15 family ATPase/GTPase
MKIEINNFGPINKANMQISPLTIIIGRNNLGKSFIAQLIYSILQSLSPFRRSPHFVENNTMFIWNEALPDQYIKSRRNSEKIFSDCFKSWKSGDITFQEFHANIVENWFNSYKEQLKISIPSTLEGVFSTKITDLISLNSTSCRINMVLSPCLRINITIRRKNVLDIKIVFDKTFYINLLSTDKNLKDLYAKHPRASASSRYEMFYTTERIFRNNIASQLNIAVPYYIPAGRGGLLDAWDTISTAWINMAPTSILRGISMPPLPGTASIFYTTLLGLSGTYKGPFYSLCSQFEKIIDGQIELSQQSKIKGKKDIYYLFETNGKSTKIPIIHAASMIKEIGPLYLFIKEILAKHDLFIIEEPESHLHPTAQRDLMKILVSLVQKGTNVVFTTHSDLLLRSVTHEVFRKVISHEKPLISLEDLAIYLIKQGAKGSVSTKIKIGKYGSLDRIPTFDEVFKELYDEEIRLEIIGHANT